MFDASPHHVYEMLMDEKKHARFTGGAAQISRDVGGAFVTNSGYSTGTTRELVQDTKIVQTWRASDWPDDHYSTLTITPSRSHIRRNFPWCRPVFLRTSTRRSARGGTTITGIL